MGNGDEWGWMDRVRILFIPIHSSGSSRKSHKGGANSVIFPNRGGGLVSRLMYAKWVPKHIQAHIIGAEKNKTNKRYHWKARNLSFQIIIFSILSIGLRGGGALGTPFCMSHCIPIHPPGGWMGKIWSPFIAIPHSSAIGNLGSPSNLSFSVGDKRLRITWVRTSKDFCRFLLLCLNEDKSHKIRSVYQKTRVQGRHLWHWFWRKTNIRNKS